MSKITFNDLSIAYILIQMAKNRDAYKYDELPGVDQCLIRLEDFLDGLKQDIENRSLAIDGELTPEPDQ